MPRLFRFGADAGLAGVGSSRPAVDVRPFEVVLAGEAGRTSNGRTGSDPEGSSPKDCSQVPRLSSAIGSRCNQGLCADTGKAGIGGGILAAPGARSSAGERPLHTREVAGSIPAAPIEARLVRRTRMAARLVAETDAKSRGGRKGAIAQGACRQPREAPRLEARVPDKQGG